MSRSAVFYFLLLMVLFSQVQSETLLERLAQERQHPKRRLLQEFVVGSDAIAGPHSFPPHLIFYRMEYEIPIRLER
ncbi:hypothetical protein Y032_0034g2846 [Ancylostoma ceylanicum]|uniref:Uncharacterized protein n=1 Tax=Ancylostoma ceylanicum TaxID=53326 RepID=A0A016ULC6_9BILA|nr:hypothetical protein Y032_0034g2846 [Ancylostoma ceylanicum]